MTTGTSLEFSRRLYGGLLNLYPRDFLDEFGAPMRQLFTDQSRCAARENGTRGMVFLWLRTISDLFVSLLREHLTPSRASAGLLEAVPNKPLPWKGVALVLIPGVVFMVGQIGQLAGEDWFDFLVRRAAYYLIVPVLLVWFIKRKFPIWGLIPLGMFYRAILELSYRYEFLIGKIGVQLADITHKGMPPGFILFLKAHTSEVRFFLTAGVIGTGIFLIIRIARREGFTRSSWAWLGVFLVVSIIETLSGLIHVWIDLAAASSTDLIYGGIASLLQKVAYSAFIALVSDMGFLLLILVGVLLARRHGRLALLLPLGYLIPTIVLGTFDTSTALPYSMFWIVASVLAFRVLVTLAAPIWIVRSASDRAQRRAGSVALPLALVILLAAHSGYLSASVAAYGYEMNWLDVYYYFSPELLILSGIALAITLYRSVDLSHAAGPAKAAAGEPFFDQPTIADGSTR